MEYTKVIKVKYGETLRRFNARVDESEQLDLDMDKLRAKVVSLFNFPPDADLTLTYTDEDGDVVTLVDDDDLNDAMGQKLNPLRINVLLNTEKGGRSSMRSSGSSTPLRSPRVQQPLPSLNSGVAEVLKSVPEPLREALSKLSLDLASKAASSAPVLAEIVESFTRMGESYLNPDSQSQVGADSSMQSGLTQSPVCPPAAKGPEASKDYGPVPVVLPNAKFLEPTSKNIQEVDIGNVTRGVGNSVVPPPVAMDLNLPSDSTLSGCPTVNLSPITSDVPTDVPAGENRKESKNENKGNLSGKTVDFGADKSSDSNVRRTYLDAFKTTGFDRSASKPYLSDFGNSSASPFGSNPSNECPFTGLPIANGSALPPIPHPHQFKRGHNLCDNMHIFHKGVRCDGCGVHPITGPRFKSKVKENYDLCSVCFSEMGNEGDYIRMDRPVSHLHPWPLKALYDPMQHPRVRPPTPPHLFRGRMKPNRPKVDSRFILDVNVMDGTTMAPSTRFTKIWRMRNNGTIVWPQGTQLVWIGGDRFSEADSVQIETPVDGVAVDMELDIAVDFRAPELPGRYISYWRMSLPSGQKFGQRVWVLIQVDASLRDPLCDSFHGLNLNLPPDSNGSRGAGFSDADVMPLVDGSILEPWNLNASAESVEQMVGERPIKDQELNFPINDTLLVGSGVLEPVPPKIPSSVGNGVSDPVPLKGPSVACPVVDFAGPPVVSYEPTLVEYALASSEGVGETNDVEQTLLKELEEMGFKQVDLNKEILRMNEYNLEQSVDDLCGVAEWDPILEELEEMGFNDKEMNRKLLKKNNGSIKRVVMDLITGEKTTSKEKTQ